MGSFHSKQNKSMKFAATALALGAAVQASPLFPEVGSGTDAVSFQTMGTYMEKNFDWANFDQEVQNAVNAGYNTLYLGFYMSLHGCQGACTAWRDLQPDVKQDVQSYLKSQNAYLGLSIGGPGEFIEGVIRDGTTQQFAQEAAQFAWDQGFSAIDIATELSGSLTQPSVWALNGSYSAFVSTMIKEAKKVGYGADQISLTSPAQYFSPNFVQCTSEQIASDSCSNALSYYALDSRESSSDAVSHLNMDMLNEDGNFLSYKQIFVNDDDYVDPYGYGSWGTGSAVQQVMNINGGINGAKVAIVKSQNPAESSIRTGYVDPASLSNWACQANNDFGWRGGFVGWTWNNNDGYQTLNWPGQLGAACTCLGTDAGCV